MKDQPETGEKEQRLRRDTSSRYRAQTGREYGVNDRWRYPMQRRKQYPKSALVRLTTDEHSRLVELAKEARLSLSRFLAESGLAGKAPSYEDRERHERAIMEVNRVGNNLNQIARQLNAQTGVINIRRVEEKLMETKKALDAMRMQFGKG